ncbi:hypothetical protein BC829DRAFT_418070 [Chytridium lagenaria]|nr:hypothetical protein BC829DRAFT_418070 [Chytridium lagenaria]
MVGKQRHLYKEYQMHKKESAEKIQESEEALRAANLSREAAEIKANDLDKVISTLKDGTHDTIKRELIESQRRVTVLKVNEMNLKRRYSSLADVEKNLRKENVKLHEDVLCLDNAARQTIGRFCAESGLQHGSEPSGFMQAKTRLFLDKERSWIEDRERNEGEARELIQLRRKVEQLESDIYEAHELNKRLGSSLKEVESAKDYNYQTNFPMHSINLLVSNPRKKSYTDAQSLRTINGRRLRNPKVS